MTEEESVGLCAFTSNLRKAGVRRLVFGEPADFAGFPILEIELSDTIPAPPSFEALDETEPPKPPGTCIAIGCMEPGGWHFDRRYCAPHGRAAAGVKP
jgi:hypothetical protein